MQYVLVSPKYEESSYSILIKSNFCNFTLWLPGVIAPFAPPPSARHCSACLVETCLKFFSEKHRHMFRLFLMLLRKLDVVQA